MLRNSIRAIGINHKLSWLMLPAVVFALFLNVQAYSVPAADPAARLDEAQNHLNRGKHAEAEPIFRDVSEEAVDGEIGLQARKGLAIACAAQKKHSDVDTVVDRLISDFPGDQEVTQAVCNVGDQYYNKQDFVRARQLFGRTVNDCPQNAFSMWAQCGIASSSIRLGDDAAADVATAKLIDDYLGHEHAAIAICLIADNYRQLHKTEKANDLYQMVVKNWPGDEHAMWSRMHLTMSSIEGGNLAAAAERIDGLFTNYSQHPYFIRAVCYIAGRYYDRQEFDKATQLYQRIADKHPEATQEMWPQVISLIANLRLTDTDITIAAIDRIRADYASHPELPEAISWLAEIYYKKGTDLQNEGLSDQAKDQFQKAIAIWEKNTNQTTDSDHRCLAYYHSALSYQYIKDHDKAVDYFNTIIEDYPLYERRWHALSMLAVLYEEMHQANKMPQEAANTKIREMYQEILES